MDGQVRDIPGYYYDREKKKYFKVQASSTAPSSSAYSSFDVKRRKLEDAKSDAEIKAIARQKGRVRLSKALEHSSLRKLLAEEHGYSRLDPSENIVGGLVHYGYLRRSEAMRLYHFPLFIARPSFNIGPCIVDMRIVMGPLNAVRLDQCDLNTDNGPENAFQHGFAITATCDEDQYWIDTTELTSLSCNIGENMYTRTWLSRADAGISIVRGHTGWPNDDQGHLRPATAIIGPGVSHGREISIYSSTPAPSASSLLFAYGTSHGIMTVDKANMDGKFISPEPTPGSNHPTDVFSLEFLSDNHSVLLSGGRRGILNITDLRIPKFGTETDTITHPSSITHIRQLDPHRILVSGLNSSLRQYDLRFRKLDTPSSQRKRKKLRSLYNASATRSILEYPGYYNTASIQHGLDIEPETGVVAVCQEHDNVHPPVQIFSLHGGHTIRVPALETIPYIEQDHVVRCLQWVEDIEHRAKSLWIGCSRGIERFAWTDFDKSEELNNKERENKKGG